MFRFRGPAIVAISKLDLLALLDKQLTKKSFLSGQQIFYARGLKPFLLASFLEYVGAGAELQFSFRGLFDADYSVPTLVNYSSSRFRTTAALLGPRSSSKFEICYLSWPWSRCYFDPNPDSLHFGASPLFCLGPKLALSRRVY